MAQGPAYAFEREHSIHETRDAKGIINRLRPIRWLKYNATAVQLRTVGALEPFLGSMKDPVVIVVGVGMGNIYNWLWRAPGTMRIGIDVNHEVMLQARAEFGADHYLAVEADGRHLPFQDGSVDVVFYDFSLHHLIGQGPLEAFIAEGARVLRPGGFIVAREPSNYSPSGVAFNVLNRFGLMHKLTGASSQEFALSPPLLIRMFQRHGSMRVVEGLTYLFAHRLPPWIQDLITKSEPYLFSGPRRRWLADFVLYAVEKTPDAAEGARDTTTNRA